jgi:hypothetical protein
LCLEDAKPVSFVADKLAGVSATYLIRRYAPHLEGAPALCAIADDPFIRLTLQLHRVLHQSGRVHSRAHPLRGENGILGFQRILFFLGRLGHLLLLLFIGKRRCRCRRIILVRVVAALALFHSATAFNVNIGAWNTARLETA